MTRRSRFVVAAVVGAAAACSVAVGPASALTSVPAGASATSFPGYTGSASMAASLGLTGAIGGLLSGLISPIVNNALNPLVADLQGTVDTTIASTVGVSGSYKAATPSLQTPPAPGTFPGDLPAGLPSPCTSTSTTQPCYSATGSSASLAPVAALTLGALRGYTQQVPSSTDATNPIFGRAQIASASVTALSAVSSLTNPLVSVGTIDSKSNCPSTGTPVASVSAANVVLLGGGVTVTVASNAISAVKVGATSYTLSALPTSTVAGFTLAKYGSLLKLSTTLSAAQVVTGLGLSGTDVTNLLSYATTGTGLTLSVLVGPGSSTTGTSASAWGLAVGLDLAGTLTFNLLGLVNASVSLPSGIGGGNFGNVLDARLAYTACNPASGTSSTSTAAVPPALI